MFSPKRRLELVIGIFLVFAACIAVSDLFLHPGRPVTFDGPTHLTTIAQFYNGLKSGQFPVYWADSFANYGMPIPLIAQQTTSYTAAFLTFLTHDVTVSYNLTYLFGSVLATLLMYVFLRRLATPHSAFLGALLFTFAPYRLLNIYTRGAQPEYFASVFILSALIGMHDLVVKKRWYGAPIFTLSIAFLFLTHPMMVVIGSLVMLPFALLLLMPLRKNLGSLAILVGSGLLGIVMCGYYFLPLMLEIKYFYYGLSKVHLMSDQFLSLTQYFQFFWPYFGGNDIGPRTQVFHLGALELLIVVVGFVLTGFAFLKKKIVSKQLVLLLGFVAFLILLTLPISKVFYQIFLPLNNIQHPWRILSALVFFPSILLALLFDKIPDSAQLKKPILALLTLAILLSGVPNLYAKNFMLLNPSFYAFTRANLHGNVLNTIWTGDTKDYPTQSQKFAITDGVGTFVQTQVTNGNRVYQLHAETELRVVDFTFYFPGWKAYVDDQEVPIEFQDPNYRGVITYRVPVGDHRVRLSFEDTKIRLFGKLMSVVGCVGLVLLSAFLIRVLPLPKPKK